MPEMKRRGFLKLLAGAPVVAIIPTVKESSAQICGKGIIAQNEIITANHALNKKWISMAEMAYQMAKKGKSLKRDMEIALDHNLEIVLD